MTQRIDRTVLINSSPSVVWEALTRPDVMQRWMAEPEMDLEIITDWGVEQPITIRGFHHVRFENRGTVLRFEPDSLLQYSHLSSLSGLPDEPEHYTTVAFRLSPVAGQTSLTVSLRNFPTEAIFKHVDFYWRTTIHRIKDVVENKI